MSRATMTRPPFGVPGVFSLAATPLGWLWYLMNLFPRERAWWNSPLLFVVLFAATTALAFWSIRSLFGVVALLLALPSLGLVCLFAFYS